MGMFNKDENEKKEQATQGGYEQTSSVYDQVGDAEISKNAIYPLPGAYPVLMIDCMKMIVSRDGDDFFIAEIEIIESKVEERPSGTRMVWMANFRHDPTPGAIRAFMAAVMNTDPNEVDSKGAQFACSDKNPTHGRLVSLQATKIETKKKTAFTKCIWFPIADEIQTQVKELRANAGFAPF